MENQENIDRQHNTAWRAANLPVAVVTITEGHVRGVEVVETSAEATAFARGFWRGASYYGADQANGVVWPPSEKSGAVYEPETIELARHALRAWMEDDHRDFEGREQVLETVRITRHEALMLAVAGWHPTDIDEDRVKTALGNYTPAIGDYVQAVGDDVRFECVIDDVMINKRSRGIRLKLRVVKAWGLVPDKRS